MSLNLEQLRRRFKKPAPEEVQEVDVKPLPPFVPAGKREIVILPAVAEEVKKPSGAKLESGSSCHHKTEESSSPPSVVWEVRGDAQGANGFLLRQ